MPTNRKPAATKASPSSPGPAPKSMTELRPSTLDEVDEFVAERTSAAAQRRSRSEGRLPLVVRAKVSAFVARHQRSGRFDDGSIIDELEPDIWRPETPRAEQRVDQVLELWPEPIAERSGSSPGLVVRQQLEPVNAGGRHERVHQVAEGHGDEDEAEGNGENGHRR